ncbi:hypothetical protein GN956_G16590 [Arapaima gigas]
MHLTAASNSGGTGDTRSPRGDTYQPHRSQLPRAGERARERARECACARQHFGARAQGDAFGADSGTPPFLGLPGKHTQSREKMWTSTTATKAAGTAHPAPANMRLRDADARK